MEHGTKSQAAADADCSSISSCDLIADPQPQPAANVFFRGEERFEKPADVVGLNPRAVVRNRDANTSGTVQRDGLDPNVNHAIARDRVYAVGHQVGEELAQLTGIRRYRGAVSVTAQLELDGLETRLVKGG